MTRAAGASDTSGDRCRCLQPAAALYHAKSRCANERSGWHNLWANLPTARGFSTKSVIGDFCSALRSVLWWEAMSLFFGCFGENSLGKAALLRWCFLSAVNKFIMVLVVHHLIASFSFDTSIMPLRGQRSTGKQRFRLSWCVDGV